MTTATIFRVRVHCHVCCKNVVDARTENGPLTAKAYCPGNPTHQCTVATWEEKKPDGDA